MGHRARGGIPIKIMITVIFVAVFCALPVFLLIQNAVQSSHQESLASAKTLGSPNNGYFGAATPVYSSPRSDVCVAFEFLGFDPSTSFASFATVVSATSAGAGYIRQEISDGYGTGVLVIRSYFGLSSIMVPFPLADLTTGSLSAACTTGNSAPYMGGVGFRQQESSYMLGQPRAFPNDWYEFDDTIGIYLCTARQAADQCTAQLNLQSEVSMAQLGGPSVIATTRDPDLAMTVATGKSTLVQAHLVELRFVLHRPGWFAAYTYLIAAMPFLLIFGLFAVYAHRSSTRDGGRVEYSPERTVPSVHEIAFGVAATLVAILPLHMVLVPSSLPNLTQLDLFFGTGVALLVALSLAWVIIWSQRKPVEAQQAPGG